VPLRERVVLHYFTVADLQYLDPFEETEDNYEAGVAKYTMLNAEAMWILWSTLSCLDDMFHAAGILMPNEPSPSNPDKEGMSTL
jgi:hypothetical protein